MDQMAVIVGDSLARIQQTFEAWVAPAAPAVEEAHRSFNEVVLPGLTSVTRGVVALQEFTGPQLFTTIVLVCGVFVLLAVGSAVAYRSP
ncbi:MULTISPECIES: hypothetical protein [Microbacterium]|uniref:Uncharacterized protein n=1 Tax=Microbacterium hominis TaxID=162426 RepID=A0A2K9D9F8_9MICO|nr:MULTISPECIES: hypothetical protein [Microbacterium]AUG29512.1 hypothetical protein CXR34_08675 [Microbacterium hominis]EPD84213.1 hypothetical protein HMPREF1529_02278 [Microbacterium sp. oral taxon 186 str. F0373]